VHDTAQFVGARLGTAQCHRTLKLARTIADLAGSDEIQSVHFAEALHASQSSEGDEGVDRKSRSRSRWLALQIRVKQTRFKV